MTDRESTPRTPAADDAESERAVAADAVHALVSPTAPGQPDSSKVAVDLPQVTPPPQAPMSRYLVIGGASATAFALLTWWVVRHGVTIPALDANIHAWALTRRTGADLTLARAVTTGGVTSIALPALVVIGALAPRGRRPLRNRLGAGVLLAGVASAGVYLGLVINAAVDRVRPAEVDWAGAAGGPAYPSGHTTAATLFAISCAWALSDRVGPGWPRRGLWCAAVGYAFAVGWSRVWLGVHWPTDVLGAWLYATAWFALSAAAIIGLRSVLAGRRSTRGRPQAG